MSKEMTPKEAFSNIVTYDINDSGRTVGDYCEEECNIVGKALTDYEQLQRDVKRYFELQYKNQFGHMTQNDIHDMYVLREKLSEVGK